MARPFKDARYPGVSSRPKNGKLIYRYRAKGMPEIRLPVSLAIPSSRRPTRRPRRVKARRQLSSICPVGHCQKPLAMPRAGLKRQWSGWIFMKPRSRRTRD